MKCVNFGKFIGSIELAELKLETSANIHKMKSQIFFIFAYLRNKYIFSLQHLNLSYFLLLSQMNPNLNFLDRSLSYFGSNLKRNLVQIKYCGFSFMIYFRRILKD